MNLENESFETTRWSLVFQAHDSSEALETLCQTYWFPLYAFARKTGKSPSDAEDLVQGFFAKLLEKEIFNQADSNRGKLRTFLLTHFRGYETDEYRKTQAEKRGGSFKLVSFDADDAEACYERQVSDRESPEEAYDRQWALTVMEQALGSLRDHWERKGKVEHFDLIRPFLTAPPDPNAYAAVGEQLGIGLSGVKSAVARMRSQFGSFLRDEVRETQLDETNFQEEMRVLFSAFL